MNPRTIFRCTVVMCITVLGAVSTAFAQTNQGQIAGNVLDRSGAVISGAVITARCHYGEE